MSSTAGLDRTASAVALAAQRSTKRLQAAAGAQVQAEGKRDPHWHEHRRVQQRACQLALWVKEAFGQSSQLVLRVAPQAREF